MGGALALAALLAVVQSNFVSTRNAGARTLDGVDTGEQAAPGREIDQRSCSAVKVVADQPSCVPGRSGPGRRSPSDVPALLVASALPEQER
jgi:hypothetical protein